ncbi:oxygen-independent coproporphyrinogen III oxidase [Pseudooceanicola sp. CBS1P-1]|uniref:Coproporphyrinogen-III oxidase n=1 Tax=Pseudooceanicola albus TaxID=2692189 RepID=A0A6L7GAS0_9RHOB|nr:MULTISPECIES: oxygen-independent coproporphyrinogen III oxidase [Pseudooceanicola]MBT9386386.1 oxygen-independent coproporphyrinogen III oxidase [Pseudooceanicola endophyticus]MXN20456.1 oxygen-independent coproporphyrinogen III oxidase [Pseudooceanicola albus]
MVNKTQLARLGLFDAKVPRYTSYPTAPHFSDSVGADRHAAWIEAIPAGSAISLYVHVPFCRRLCWFCACRTQGTQTMSPVEAYLETLLEELDLLARHLPEGVRLSRLHWGGGTPTLLTAPMMETLAGRIAEVVPFADSAEFSVEIDPNEVDEARMKALAAAGMNRASIGVQDFDPAIQTCIGREQGYEVTRSVAEGLRAHGIHSLNADILYGLPYQTPAKITDSVQKLLSLAPDRVALYGYAHVPWMARRQSMLPSDALPTPTERLDLFETARKLFLWDNYAEIGIDHFALPGDGLATAQKAGQLRRNFQGYTDDQADVLIGLGASSISRFPQGYTQNAPATSAHTAAIRDQRFSTTRGHVFRDEDRMRARIIEALMCDFRVSEAEISERFQRARSEVHALFTEAAAGFEDLLRLTEEGLFIPEDARPLTRMIARCFDSYDASRARHSSAI